MSRQMSLWLRAESKAQPPGLTSYGWGGGPVFSDAFRFRRAPSLPALAEAYKSLIYTMVKLNGEAVSRVPLRLYRLGSAKGDKAKCDARQATGRERLRLKSLAHTAKAMAGAEEVEEITGDHPLLQLTQNVNPSMDQAQLIQYTVMSMDVVGTAFWYPDEWFSFGGQRKVFPREFWPLPPHLVNPIMDGVGLVPRAYQFGTQEYEPSELLIFKHLSMKNPYGLGMSPTQAAIEYARLEDVFVSIQDDLLSNGPRPSLVVSHKDPKGAFGDAERKRLDHDLNTKARGGRSGAAIIVDGAAAVTPISFTPADLGAVEISKYDLERTAGCFGVPVSMLTNESSNRAVAEAGLEQHARQAVEPRCKILASVLTRWTHSLDQGRQKNWDKLFWAFDDCVEADKDAEADRLVKFIGMGLPINEALKEGGYDAVEGGDVSFVASNLTTLENAVKPPEPPQPPGGKPGEGGDDKPDPESPSSKSYSAIDAKATPGPKVPRAHDILSVVLDATGYRDDWEAGTLGVDEHVELLHLVRMEGRKWLRGRAIETLDEIDGLESKALFGAAKEKAKAFFGHARKYVRELFVAGVLAVAGPTPMDAAELRALDAEVAAQYAYLKTFEKEVVEGNKPPDGTFVSRAEQYGASVWGAAQEILRVGAVAATTYTREKRVHRGADKPCPVCIEEENKGWKTIGTLRKIGDSPCRCQCHCVFVFGDEASAKSFDLIGKRYVPCRDHRGRFASCGGAPQGTRHPKPADGESAKPKPGAGGGKKPKKKPAKPKPAAKPAKEKLKPAEKPDKETAKPTKPAKPAKPKPAESKPKPSAAKPEAATPAAPGPGESWTISPDKAKDWVKDSVFPQTLFHRTYPPAKADIEANGINMKKTTGVYGQGLYASTKQEKAFGPSTVEVALNIRNPLIGTGDDIHRLQREWGPPGMPLHSTGFRDEVVRRGYDSVIMHWDEKYQGPSGNNWVVIMKPETARFVQR